jgi:predicted ferric reductase
MRKPEKQLFRGQSYGQAGIRHWLIVFHKFFTNNILLKSCAYNGQSLPSFFFTFHSHSLAMGNLLYLIAVVLIIIWAISFFGGYYTGGIIHTLLVIAIIAVLLRVISGRSAV